MVGSVITHTASNSVHGLVLTIFVRIKITLYDQSDVIDYVVDIGETKDLLIRGYTQIVDAILAW